MKKGDWIADLDDNQIGKVREVYDEGWVDVILYNRSGKRLGRLSDAGDGPKSFEPCCDQEGWKVIEEPRFPLPSAYYLNEIVKVI